MLFYSFSFTNLKFCQHFLIDSLSFLSFYLYFLFTNFFYCVNQISGGFQLSPDFRQRASSNASSCGRLSPIPAIVGVEPDWSFTSNQQDFTQNDTQSSAALDQLAGSLADELTLQNEYLQGSVFLFLFVFYFYRFHLFLFSL